MSVDGHTTKWNPLLVLVGISNEMDLAGISNEMALAGISNEMQSFS